MVDFGDTKTTVIFKIYNSSKAKFMIKRLN